MKLVLLTVAEMSKAKSLANALVANLSDDASVTEARKFLSDLRIPNYPAPRITYQIESNVQTAKIVFYLALVTTAIMYNIADKLLDINIKPSRDIQDVLIAILYALLILSVMHPLSNFYGLPTLEQAVQNTRNFVPNLIANTRESYRALPTLKQATKNYINNIMSLHHMPALFTTASTAKSSYQPQLSVDVEPLRDADLDKMDASQILNFYKEMFGEVFLGLSAAEENQQTLSK